MANRVYDKAFSFIAALGVVLHSRRAICMYSLLIVGISTKS